MAYLGSRTIHQSHILLILSEPWCWGKMHPFRNTGLEVTGAIHHNSGRWKTVLVAQIWH